MREPFAAYLAGFVVLGLASNWVGPALTALAKQVDVGLAAVSALFPAQSLGYLAGSLLAGRGYDRGGGHRLLAASLTAIALASLAIPLAPQLSALVAVFFALGLATGGLDVGGNSLLVWSRQTQLGPRMNALHLAFGVGALMAPVLVNGSLVLTGTLLGAGAGIAAIAVAVGALALPLRAPSPPRIRESARKPERRSLAAGVAIFFVVYVALEVGFAGWIHAYAQALDLGTNLATALNAGFWTAFTVGRAISVPLALRVAPGPMLGASVALGVLAAAGVLVAGDHVAALWIGNLALGLAIAPQFPCMIAWSDRNLGLTGALTARFLAASGIGGMVFPWLIGQWFERSGAVAMPWAILGASLVLAGWTAGLALASRSPRLAPGS